MNTPVPPAHDETRTGTTAAALKRAVLDALYYTQAKFPAVATLKADWTNRAPEISRMLASFDRSGVPLYLLYPRSQNGSAAGGPSVLPQILTERAVLDSLDRL